MHLMVSDRVEDSSGGVRPDSPVSRLTDGQIENLPDFVVLVPALFAHVLRRVQPTIGFTRTAVP